MKEKFEASLQSLRGPHADITMEAREIQVLAHYITYHDYVLYHLVMQGFNKTHFQ